MFKQIKQKAVRAAIRMQASLMELQQDERGMEIIQVLVLLAIGLGLIVVFIGFGDTIVSAVSDKVEDFMNNF